MGSYIDFVRTAVFALYNVFRFQRGAVQ